MNTEQLKTFLSLVETRNFSRTADQLIVSQSTVSKRIFELEKETAQQLFIREHTGVKLTRAGSAFYEYAQQIVALEERACDQIGRTNQFSDSLILGTAYAYSELYLQDILKDFLHEKSHVSVKIKSGHSGYLLNELRRAKLDIAFTHLPYSHPEFICQCIEEDEVVLVTDIKNRDHEHGITHFEIRTLPLISSNFLYATTYHWLFPANQQFQLELDLFSDALALLKNEQWYTFLPRKLVQEFLKKQELREISILDGNVPPVQYYMIYRKENLKQMSVREWIEFMKK